MPRLAGLVPLAVASVVREVVGPSGQADTVREVGAVVPSPQPCRAAEVGVAAAAEADQAVR